MENTTAATATTMRAVIAKMNISVVFSQNVLSKAFPFTRTGTEDPQTKPTESDPTSNAAVIHAIRAAGIPFTVFSADRVR